MAELSAAALCKIVGKQASDTLGNSYQYIETYAKKIDLTPLNACLRVINEVEQVLNTLSRMGITIALDDFGTGFASLAYLKDFPVEIVKIDRMFVEGTPDSKEDTAIVEAIAGLTRGLKLRLLAEGIENDRKLQMLKGLGCQLGQGFYWSKALPADQYSQFFMNRFYNIG